MKSIKPFLVVGILFVIGLLGYNYLASDKVVERNEKSMSIVEREVEMPRLDLKHDKKDLYNEDMSIVGKWNAIALEMIAGTRLNPPEASRFLGILHIAIFEAVNSIEKKYEPYDTYLFVEDEVLYNEDVVIASAAKSVIDHFYPNFALLTAEEIAKMNAEDQNAQALGMASAAQIIARRSNDGSFGSAQYDIKDEAGMWQATPPYFESPLLPHWGSVETFIEKSSEFYVTPPSPITSKTYAKEFNEVKEIGEAHSNTRTEDQSEIAKFWADGKGTYTPPGHWNVIMHQVMNENQSLSLIEEARCFAILNIAMADAGIQTWKAKFDYEYWRPIDGIRKASRDNNVETQPSEKWFNYIETPNFPEYPSGHSAFSGAGSSVLADILGDDQSFETYSLGLPNVYRTFDSFEQAADEAGMSRIYGGIHFQKANTEGLRVGRKIGEYVVKNVMQEI